MHDLRTSTLDRSLTARVMSLTPLRYADGADAALDRPAHVRAGSSLARVPGGVAVVQDDANFIAVVDAAGVVSRAITLPAGEGGLRQFDDLRGNKRFKLDLEACVAVPHDGDTLLLAFGSGSSPARENVVLVGDWTRAEPDVRVVHLPRLYEALRAETAFAGSELNVEGAMLVDDRLRLFQRGNGAARGELVPVDATCDLAWPALLAHIGAPLDVAPPMPTDVVRYRLGDVSGVPLTFTDATRWRGRTLYTAAAESSPDATRDGPVAGSAIGVIDDDGRARWTPVMLESGEPFAAKIEGVVADPEHEDRLLIAIDVDSSATPSELCVVELGGPWAG